MALQRVSGEKAARSEWGRRPGTRRGAGAVGPVGRVRSLQSWARELLQGPWRRVRLGKESLRLWLLAASLMSLSGKLQRRILRLREAWETGLGLPVACCPEVWWWWFSPLSHCPTLWIPWTVYSLPGFSVHRTLRQEYWSFHFPSSVPKFQVLHSQA